MKNYILVALAIITYPLSLLAANKEAQAQLAQIKSAAPVIAAQAAVSALAMPDYLEEIKIWALDNDLYMTEKDWDAFDKDPKSLDIATRTN